MREELRVGVIGTGRMGAFHVHAWSRLERARLTAVADPSSAARNKALGGYEAEEYADWRQMLALSEIDAVSIACPSELHAEAASAALAAGLHVLVEKPIATSLPDALRLRAAARSAGRKLMVGHVERFNPVVEALREMVADGALGRIFRAHAMRVGPLPERIRDAGVAIDLATHDLDVIQHVLDCQATDIYADGGSFVHPTQEDLLTCLVRFGDDAIPGLLDVNWLTPDPRRELTLIGERGMVRASYITQALTLTEPPDAGGARPGPRRIVLDKQEPLLAELDAFIDCVLDDTAEPVSAHDGVRALAAALAVRESAAQRRAVRLLDIPAPPALQVVA